MSLLHFIHYHLLLMTLLLPPTPHLTAERLRLPPGPPHSGYHDICPFCPGAAVGGWGHRPLHHTRTESLHPVSLHRSGREAQVHWSQVRQNSTRINAARFGLAARAYQFSHIRNDIQFFARIRTLRSAQCPSSYRGILHSDD